MIILGFNGVASAKYKESGESDVLLLDISNDSEYVWTTSFDPSPVTDNPKPSSPLISKPKTNNIGIIIGCVVGLILLICIISIAVFLFIKRRKNANKAIPTPGDTDGIPSEQELSSRRV
jgi:hypothetical protein